MIEDNRADAEFVEAIFTTLGRGRFLVEHADRLSVGLRRLSQGQFDVALLDLMLPDSDGIETFMKLSAGAPGVPIVILTVMADEAVAVQAVEGGAQDYLIKTSLDGKVLCRALRYAIERHRMLAQVQRYARELAVSEARFRSLVQNSSDIITVTDPDGTIRYASPSTEAVLGHSSSLLVGKNAFGFVHPGDAATLRAFLDRVVSQPARAATAEYRLRHVDGSWIDLEAVGNNRLTDPAVVGIVVNARNLTDRRRLEAQLRQSQKMEAIGNLAGGIAHDFNNLLTIIIGHTHLQLQRLGANHSDREEWELIRETADRGAALIRQLLVFSRQQVVQPVVLDLNSVVEGIGGLLQRLLGEHIELVIASAPDLGRVRADPGHIEQVIVNLAVNARDAMLDGGRLTIETANVELDAEYARRHVGAQIGPHVMLAVSDTGSGMDAETQSRMFEPFFTTKEPGKGTGLGLSTVYGIVQQCGGTIWVYSEIGHGTTFKIYLPRIETTAGAAAPSAPTETVAGGSETVLVVEDEDRVRELVSEILTLHGYTVLMASTAGDALLLSERHEGPIHLLVTDLVMPTMSGRALARRVAERRPETKALYLSGYTGDTIVRHGMLEADMAFLQKPFTVEGLTRKVREMLDARSESA
jgi:PAS domain S-box-containing protein